MLFDRLALTAMLILVLLTGYFAGRVVDTQIAFSAPMTTLQPDTRSPTPTIVLERIRNGKLEGTITSNLRLFVGKEELLNSSGSFTIAAGVLAKPEKTVEIPTGMYFVASKRGKKFYPVLSAGGQTIAVENRVYFQNADAAMAAGYRE